MWVKAWLRLQFLSHEQGQDMAEYALLIALIALMALLMVSAVGNAISDTLYNRLALYIQNAIR